MHLVYLHSFFILLSLDFGVFVFSLPSPPFYDKINFLLGCWNTNCRHLQSQDKDNAEDLKRTACLMKSTLSISKHLQA